MLELKSKLVFFSVFPHGFKLNDFNNALVVAIETDERGGGGERSSSVGGASALLPDSERNYNSHDPLCTTAAACCAQNGDPELCGFCRI